MLPDQVEVLKHCVWRVIFVAAPAVLVLRLGGSDLEVLRRVGERVEDQDIILSTFEHVFDNRRT